ncbi:ACT domain repeat 3 [Striga asiatica]|uniref:ACT domain repeat 3 n=1 Tax=Striga asiatica TaxID=4170 RepID=A0A5A7QXG9_STRAF|nr:ACT domain repeat 3 [Striga asiatica]
MSWLRAKLPNEKSSSASFTRTLISFHILCSTKSGIPFKEASFGAQGWKKSYIRRSGFMEFSISMKLGLEAWKAFNSALMRLDGRFLVVWSSEGSSGVGGTWSSTSLIELGVSELALIEFRLMRFIKSDKYKNEEKSM